MAKRVDARRGNKYHAVKTTVDGMRFDSKGEAHRWSDLRLLEHAGHVRNLRRQVRFHLMVFGPEARVFSTLGYYVADFVYDCKNQNGWHECVEDFKGFRTPLYRWKKKHFEFQYGVTIHETETRVRGRA